jgi:putative holliday junction resolvase
VSHNEPEEFLGVDVGDMRVGIARGSSLARIAEPVKTTDAKEAISELIVLIDQFKANGVVVGLPRNLTGAETAQTKKVRQWAERAKDQIKLPFYWQDEALTSVEVEKIGAQKVGSDALAASVILQDFLDTPKQQRVRC